MNMYASEIVRFKAGDGISNEIGRSRPRERGITAKTPNSANQAQNILHLIHDRPSQFARALGAVAQNRIDIGGIVLKPSHLRANRTEFRNRQIDQTVLESGKLRAAELAQDAFA